MGRFSPALSLDTFRHGVGSSQLFHPERPLDTQTILVISKMNKTEGPVSERKEPDEVGATNLPSDSVQPWQDSVSAVPCPWGLPSLQKL